MTPVTTRTHEHHNGSATMTMPTTADEARAIIATLDAETLDLLVALKKIDERIVDAEFAHAPDNEIEALEAQRVRVQRQRDRKAALLAHLRDDVLPGLRKSDTEASANRHLAEAQRLENAARPLRKALRDALVEALKSVRALDDLKRQHAEHANAYNGACRTLDEDARPNVTRYFDLPVAANMRNHRAALDALAAALANKRDPEHLADALDRLLMPFAPALPFALDEEED